MSMRPDVFDDHGQYVPRCQLTSCHAPADPEAWLEVDTFLAGQWDKALINVCAVHHEPSIDAFTSNSVFAAA